MYKFVMIPNMTAIEMIITERGLKMRIRNAVTLGIVFWMRRPTESGTIKPTAATRIRRKGICTPMSRRSNKMRPNVKLHSGIIAIAKIVEIVVIVTDKLMLPFSSNVNIPLGGPPGTIPEKNKPSAISGRSGKSQNPKPKAVSGIITD